MSSQRTPPFPPKRLVEHPWDEPGLVLPEQIGEVPGMLMDAEKRMLYWLTREWYAGEGTICDLGSYLGGSTICFLTALDELGETRRVVHAYDYWKLGEFERQRDFADDPPPYDLSLPIFARNTAGYEHLAYAHSGDLLNHRWHGSPIEILFVDIAKSYLTWDHIVSEFFGSLIPGHSIVVLQDYVFEESGPWHHVVMEKLGESFDYVTDTGRNSALFFHSAPFAPGALEKALWNRIDEREKGRLMDRAIARMDTEEKRQILEGPREILTSGRHPTFGIEYHHLVD
jgi:hypothetical protein